MPRHRKYWCRRFGPGPGRPMKPRFIGMVPDANRFSPVTPVRRRYLKDPIIMTYDELEALRLIDYLGLTQEEAAEKMKISRGTVWRCLDSARKKIIAMVIENRELVVNDGN